MPKSESNSRRSSCKDDLNNLFDKIGCQIDNSNLNHQKLIDSSKPVSRNVNYPVITHKEKDELKDFYSVKILIVDEDIS
jgi:hypothetical protein